MTKQFYVYQVDIDLSNYDLTPILRNQIENEFRRLFQRYVGSEDFDGFFEGSGAESDFIEKGEGDGELKLSFLSYT